jgi:hypothetical protein
LGSGPPKVLRLTEGSDSVGSAPTYYGYYYNYYIKG